MEEAVLHVLLFYAGGMFMALVMVLSTIDHDEVETFDVECLILVVLWPILVWFAFEKE